MTGGSSYVVSLPKNWVISQNINKNDPIGIVVQEDNSLLLTTKLSGEKRELVKKFDIDTFEDSEFLFRSLIGSYIAGFDIIKINSKTRIPPFARKTVSKFIQMTIGQEVFEETDNAIIIKDLLNPLEMPFNNTIRRMVLIVKSMHKDAIGNISDHDKVLAEDVLLRDNDVDRLHWLIARQSSILLRNANLGEKLDIKPGMIINYFLISRFLERIGDHAVYMINNIENLGDLKIEKKIINLLTNADEQTLVILDKSIESLFKKKIKLANESIKGVPKIINLCKKINTEVLSKKGSVAIPLGYIVESIRRSAVYSGDIAEFVINNIIQED